VLGEESNSGAVVGGEMGSPGTDVSGVCRPSEHRAAVDLARFRPNKTRHPTVRARAITWSTSLPVSEFTGVLEDRVPPTQVVRSTEFPPNLIQPVPSCESICAKTAELEGNPVADAMELVSKLRPMKSEGMATPGEAVFTAIETAVCAAAPHASSQTAASANLPASEITDLPTPVNNRKLFRRGWWIRAAVRR